MSRCWSSSQRLHSSVKLSSVCWRSLTEEVKKITSSAKNRDQENQEQDQTQMASLAESNTNWENVPNTENASTALTAMLGHPVLFTKSWRQKGKLSCLLGAAWECKELVNYSTANARITLLLLNLRWILIPRRGITSFCDLRKCWVFWHTLFSFLGQATGTYCQKTFLNWLLPHTEPLNYREALTFWRIFL